MLKIEVKGDCLTELDMVGEVTEIVAELGAAVGAMYNNIRMVNPRAANAFRAMVGLALMPGSPAWAGVDEMNRYFKAGLMLGQFHSMTQGERMELRAQRMIEWRSWWEKVLGRAFPMRKERNHLRWPDVPEAERERYCCGWGCTKKVPAGRLVCPWCGRMEQADDFSWMDVLAMPRETVDMGNGICKTVFWPADRDGGTVLERYTRMSAEAIELKAELVTEVPAETVRALLEELGVAGDS